MKNNRIIGQLIIYSCAYASEEGLICLTGKDSTGKDIEIVIPKTSTEPGSETDYIPGRLHLNAVPVEIRSVEEKEIVAKLLWASVLCTTPKEGMVLKDVNAIILNSDIKDYTSALNQGEHYAIAYTIKEVIEYIISDAYARMAFAR